MQYNEKYRSGRSFQQNLQVFNFPRRLHMFTNHGSVKQVLALKTAEHRSSFDYFVRCLCMWMDFIGVIAPQPPKSSPSLKTGVVYWVLMCSHAVSHAQFDQLVMQYFFPLISNTYEVVTGLALQTQVLSPYVLLLDYASIIRLRLALKSILASGHLRPNPCFLFNPC